MPDLRCCFLLLLLFSIIGNQKIAYSAVTSRKAQLVFENDPKKRISGLVWDATTAVEVLERTKSAKTNQIELYVVLKGSFKKEDYSVLINDVPLPEGELASFQKEILIHGPTEVVRFAAIGPKGDLETERITIQVPQFNALRSESLFNQTKKRLLFSASIGPSIVNYTQSEEGTSITYNQMFLTVRLNAVYLLSKLWELSANTFYNALKLKSNQSDSVPFLGLNGRVGYVNTINPKWKVVYNFGWYYVTTMSSGAGFQNLSGPQVFPLIRYTMAEAKSAFAYFKLSPISNQLSFLSLSNREIAFGGGYSFPFQNRSYTVGLDISSISLNFDETNTKASTATLSIGTAF